MLPHSYRLQLRHVADFFSTARRVATASIIWYYLPTALNRPQVAVIVPKKKIAQTVTRNQVKRRLHEVLYKNLQSVPARALVVYWNSRRTPTVAELEREVQHGLQRVAQYQ